jgi:hypothetical protein
VSTWLPKPIRPMTHNPETSYPMTLYLNTISPRILRPTTLRRLTFFPLARQIRLQAEGWSGKEVAVWAAMA